MPGLALVGVPFGLFVALAAQLLPLPGGLRIPALVLLTALSGLLLWSLLATRYPIDGTRRTVRGGGAMSWRIALGEIESVAPARDARSGPARSLDRWWITDGAGRRMLLWPRDQRAFTRERKRGSGELREGGFSL